MQMLLFTVVIMTAITTCHLAPGWRFSLGILPRRAFTLSECFTAVRDEGCSSQGLGVINRGGPVTPTFAFIPTRAQTSARVDRGYSLLLGGRVSSALQAAGAVFPPELPAWISRPPACLSWLTESYPIPENLSINGRVTRPANEGMHIWTTKELNQSPRCGCGIYPWNQGSVIKQVLGTPSLRNNFSVLGVICNWSERLVGKCTCLKEKFLFLDYLKTCCISILISLANFNKHFAPWRGSKLSQSFCLICFWPCHTA